MKTILSSRRHRYLAAISILLIFSVAVLLIAGMVGCVGNDGEAVKIQDWKDLNDIRNNLEGSYLLVNNLSESTTGYDEFVGDTTDKKGWQPIGAEGKAFKGTFDGNGNTISDIFIDRPDEDEVGLFGRIQQGVVTNVGLVNVNVTGRKYVGALVGYNWKGTVDSDTRPPYSKTYSYGSITGGENVGGLVGNNYDGTVNQCESDADVFHGLGAPSEERWRAGGLVGLNSGFVLNCKYNGAVNGDRQVGGLVGLNEVGRVEDCGGEYSVDGNLEVGGVAGRNMGNIRRASFTGRVKGIVIGGGLSALNEDATANARPFDTTILGSYVGGFVGVNEGTVEDCSAEASVEGYRYIGGLAGVNGGNVTGCNSTGDVAGDSEVGRLVGYNTGTGTVSNSGSTSWVTGTSDGGDLVGWNEGHIRYSLTVSSTSGGSVTNPGEGTFTYNEGEVIHFMATPDTDCQFVEWTGDVYTIADINAASTTITMQGNYKITANFESIMHSTYKLICDVPEVIVAGEGTMIPVTLKTDELGELGYDGVQIHVKVYPRAGDVTIKLDPWSFSNELYSAPFDLPADYNQTIYPLVYCSEPGEYTFTFSLIEALYGPVIDNMTESVTVSVVEA